MPPTTKPAPAIASPPRAAAARVPVSARRAAREPLVDRVSPPTVEEQLVPDDHVVVLLEVCSQQLSQADAAREWGVDVSTVIKLRRLAKDGALAAFAASKPGRPPSVEQVELEACRQECARLTETIKEQAIELALLRGRQRSGFAARSPFA